MMKLRENFHTAFGGLEHDLRRDIYRRALLPGEKISSEIALARKYGISRNTVRKALDALCGEGLLIRVRGSGTYVSEKPPAVRLHPLSPEIRNRQILFLSLSTAFSEETLHLKTVFEPIYNGFTRVLNAYRYNFLIGHVDTSWTPPACLLNGDMAGIVFHGKVSREFREQYMEGLPCVGLQHIDPDFNCTWVCIDDFQRSFIAVRHLYQLGHRRIAYLVRGMEPDSLNELRLHAFRRSMRYFGLPCPEEYCIIAPSQRIDGERRPDVSVPDFTREFSLFRSKNPPTALITGGTLSIISPSLQKLRVRVPQDLSVIAGKNMPYEGDSFPTHICDCLEDVCAECARQIVERIENGDDSECKTILMKPKLILGNSTIPLKQEK